MSQPTHVVAQNGILPGVRLSPQIIKPSLGSFQVDRRSLNKFKIRTTPLLVRYAPFTPLLLPGSTPLSWEISGTQTDRQTGRTGRQADRLSGRQIYG